MNPIQEEAGDRNLYPTINIESDIKISKDELFKIVQELKEIRQFMKEANTKSTLIKKHNLKVQYGLLDKILTNDGINFLFDYVKQFKQQKDLIEAIKEEDKNEN